MRCFLAVEIPTEIKSKCKQVEERFKHIEGRIKLVEEENIHFTVKFLGEVNEPKIEEIKTRIKKLCCEKSPFFVVLKGVGVFPGLSYIRVLWIGTGKGTNNLKNLFEDVDEEVSKIGFKREREYTPHLTIGRIKSLKEKDKFINIVKELENMKLGKVKVDKISLFKSELKPTGSVYTCLERFHLGEHHQ